MENNSEITASQWRQERVRDFLLILIFTLFAFFLLPGTQTQLVERAALKDNQFTISREPFSVEELDQLPQEEFPLSPLQLMSWDDEEEYECEYLIEIPGVCVIVV